MATQPIVAELLRPPATERAAKGASARTADRLDAGPSEFGAYLKTARGRKKDEQLKPDESRDASPAGDPPPAEAERGRPVPRKDSVGDPASAQPGADDPPVTEAGQGEVEIQKPPHATEPDAAAIVAAPPAICGEHPVPVVLPAVVPTAEAQSESSPVLTVDQPAEAKQADPDAGRPENTGRVATDRTSLPTVSAEASSLLDTATVSRTDVARTAQGQSAEAQQLARNQAEALSQLPTGADAAPSEEDADVNETVLRSGDSPKEKVPFIAVGAPEAHVRPKGQGLQVPAAAAEGKPVVRASQSVEQSEPLRVLPRNQPVTIADPRASTDGQDLSNAARRGVRAARGAASDVMTTTSGEAIPAASIRTGVGDADAAALARFLVHGAEERGGSLNQAAARLAPESSPSLNGISASPVDPVSTAFKAASPRQALTDILASGIEEAQPLVKTAEVLSTSGRAGRMQVLLQLNPPELGQMRLHVNMQQGAVQLRVDVANRAVGRLIESNIGDLRDALALHGIRVDRSDVVVRNHASSETGDQRNDQGQTPAQASHQDGGAGHARDQGQASGGGTPAADENFSMASVDPREALDPAAGDDNVMNAFSTTTATVDLVA